MLKVFTFFIATIFLFPCRQKTEQQETNSSDSTAVDSVAIINNPKNNFNVQTNSFTEIDSSGIIMFPLSMSESGRDGGESSY